MEKYEKPCLGSRDCVSEIIPIIGGPILTGMPPSLLVAAVTAATNALSGSDDITSHRAGLALQS